MVLLYLAPAIAVVTGAFFVQINLFAELTENWPTEWLPVWRARRTLKKQLKRKHTSADRKLEILQTLEEMDRVIAERHIKRVLGDGYKLPVRGDELSSSTNIVMTKGDSRSASGSNGSNPEDIESKI
ncbi:hypothetical protein ACFRAQ_32780 [Nocardia sp. NPDC056611]|uniref:hypothetical protein n=1 Tax=Nocardia sp. NPDC056611 TaxID=3345877 RepID=UPI00366B6FA4